MTSPWVLQLRKGSFRGVGFDIEGHELSGGRRIASHEFPYKDLAYTEDLGKKQRTFSLNLFIVGSNYFASRNALIEALEAPGPGILVHPYLNGNKNVVVDSYSQSEKMSDGGLTTFTVTFRETGNKPEPVGVADYKSLISDAASRLQAAAATDFLDFNVDGAPSFVFASAISLINSAAAVLQKTTTGIPGSPSALAELSYSVRNLKGSAAELLRKPESLANSIVGSIKSLTSILNLDGLLPEDNDGKVIVKAEQAVLDSTQGSLMRGAFSGFLEFYKTLPVTYDTTQSRKTEKQNQELFQRLVTLSAISELASVSSDTSYGSTAEALAQRDLLISSLEDILFSDTVSDDTYGAVQDLQAAISRAIPDPLGETPRLSLIPLYQVTPTLSIVYDLYESLDLENDVILRNNISHPGFISPVAPLEVIAGD